MAQADAHLARYRKFREDGFREVNSAEIRVEALFLAAFHYIEACAAHQGVHINKHQNVRKELDANTFIFGSETATVWKAFQELETRIRPKFVYGSRWTAADFERAKKEFGAIEACCRKVVP